MHAPEWRQIVGDVLDASTTIRPSAPTWLAGWYAQLRRIEVGFAQQGLEAEAGQPDTQTGDLGHAEIGEIGLVGLEHGALAGNSPLTSSAE